MEVLSLDEEEEWSLVRSRMTKELFFLACFSCPPDERFASFLILPPGQSTPPYHRAVFSVCRAPSSAHGMLLPLFVCVCWAPSGDPFVGQMRLRDGLQLLQERPDDPEVLHAVGVGLAHRGIAALEYEASWGVWFEMVDLFFFYVFFSSFFSLPLPPPPPPSLVVHARAQKSSHVFLLFFFFFVFPPTRDRNIEKRSGGAFCCHAAVVPPPPSPYRKSSSSSSGGKLIRERREEPSPPASQR